MMMNTVHIVKSTNQLNDKTINNSLAELDQTNVQPFDTDLKNKKSFSYLISDKVKYLKYQESFFKKKP